MYMLIEMDDPETVYGEALRIVVSVYPEFDQTRTRAVFSDVLDLFGGFYPGYRGCNTEYHNLRHTTDVFLAFARVIHGLHLMGRGISAGNAELGLVSALLHDTGYIQRRDDPCGTGGKYTRIHVERSMLFAETYLLRKGFTIEELSACKRMILSTSLGVRTGGIGFGSANEAAAGSALFAADLLGQMADRTYLEKLLFLYREFKEAGIMDYENEYSLLRKTLEFFRQIEMRLGHDAPYSGQCMRMHFKAAWGLDADLYGESISNNIAYLKSIIGEEHRDHRDMLNRGGIVKRLKDIEFSEN